MNKQILIVEDEDDLAELLSYHLRKENYQTVIARNGKDAINAVQCNKLDMVLLDIMLPGLNGWEVCRTLRESSKGKSLPIIMLTALSDEEARVKGLSLGADDYISKPYAMQELLLKMRRHVERQETITRLKVREQEQETALQYMVHELRNSLAAIGGFSSLALRKDEENTMLRTINAAAIHAESLLNDASLLSRLETEKEHLPLKPLAIEGLVLEAAAFFNDEAKKKNIELIVANKTASTLQCNRTAMRQVMINVIGNAVKYSREGGKVWISFDDKNERVDISVRDEGPGIGEEDLLRIFEKFYRAVESESVKGAGLGLYIVRLLMTAMGGSVTAKSRRGEGSVFTLSLMRADAVREVA